MNTIHFFISLLVLLVITACHSSQANIKNNNNTETQLPLYIDNVHIVDMQTGQVIKNRQLLIRNGKISEINTAKTPILDKQFILQDAKGHYLMPGLVDMHVHAYDPAAFVINLSHGVTHVRLMNGVKDHLTWRKELEDGSRLGSTLTVSSPIISGFENPHMHLPTHTPDEAIRAVINAKQQGYDLIKAYGNLKAPVLEALLNEAKKQNIPVAKHGPEPAGDAGWNNREWKGMVWNKLAGLQSLEHVEDIYQGPLNYQHDQQALDKTIAQLNTLNVPVTPTLNIFWHLTQISEQKQAYLDTLPKDYISPIVALEEKHNQVKRWLKSSPEMAAHNKKTFVYLQEITRQLYKAELVLLVGSDAGMLLSPHGLATHREMALMQQSGIPAIDVLRAATINAAKALGKESQMGQVAEGYIADLILSEHNPLENLQTLKQPVAVVKQGRFLSATELQDMRNNAIDDRSIWQEMNSLLSAGK